MRMKKVLAFVMAMLVAISALPLTVLASEIEHADDHEHKTIDGVVNYVSLGDSMTNGYGMEGYDHNSGVEDYADNAYPNQFADLLQVIYGEVNHAQLAMSGIRTEDIHWLLEFDYNDREAIDMIDNMTPGDKYKDENWDLDLWRSKFSSGDRWTLREICNHTRTDATFAHIAGVYYKDNPECEKHEKLVEFPDSVREDGSYSRAEKIAVIAKYYQEQVAAADIMTLSVGNGNIGVFGFGRILETIGFDNSNTHESYDYTEILHECTTEMRAKLLGMINEIKPSLVDAGYSADLVNVALYIAVSLAMNYAGTLDAILKMNSDVEIILVPVMNTFGSPEGGFEEGSLGAMMEYVVDPINQFIAALPTYMQVTNHGVYENAKFYYAEPGFVECMVETYEYPITNEIVRDRFVESIVGEKDTYYPAGDGMIWKMVAPMFNDMLGQMLPQGISVSVDNITISDLEAYEEGTLEDPDKVLSCAIYLAFEKAIVYSKDKPVTLDSILNLGGIGTLFGGVKNAIVGGLNINALMATVTQKVTADGVTEASEWYAKSKDEKSNFNEMTYSSLCSMIKQMGKSEDEALLATYAVNMGYVETLDATGLATGATQLTAYFTGKYASGHVAVELGNAINPLLVNALVTDPEVSGLLALFARCVVGNGLGAHPSEAGHNELARAVIAAYCGDKTAEDKTDANINSEHTAVAKAIVSKLTALGYLTDDQIIEIAFCAYENGFDTDKIIDETYEIVLANEKWSDAQKVEIIGIVYAALKEYKYIPEADADDKNAKYVAFAENLYNNLSKKGYLTPEQSIEIVDAVYWEVSGCGFDLSALDVKYLIRSIYNILFRIPNKNVPAVFAFAFDFGITEEEMNDPTLSDKEKLDLIFTIYGSMKESGVTDEYPEVEVVGDLLGELVTPDKNGEVLIPTAQAVAIIQAAMDSYIPDSMEDAPEDPAAAVTAVLTGAVKDLPFDKQLAVLQKVADAVDQLDEIQKNGEGSGLIPDIGGMIPGIGGSDEDSGISMEDISIYLAIAQKVIANLRAEGLWTQAYNDVKYAAISAIVFDYLMDNADNANANIDPKDLAMDVYDMLLGNPDQTIEQKIQIVVVIYDTLATDETIKGMVNLPTTGEAYDHIIALRDEILAILNNNWSGIANDLYEELQALYAELEEQTQLLNKELYALVELQKETLAEMIVERDALIAEAAELQAKLDAAIKAADAADIPTTAPDMNIDALETAVGEAQAKIEKLNDSIQTLTDKIDVDMEAVAAVEAVAAQIKAEILASESALADVIIAADQLNADLKVLYNATVVLSDAIRNVYALTFENVDGAAVVEAVKALIASIPYVVENTKDVYNKTQDAIAKVEAAYNTVKNFPETVQARVDAITNGIDNLNDIAADQLAAIRATAEACKLAVEAVVAGNSPAVEEALEKTYTELEEVVLREVTAAQTWFDENQTAVLVGAGAIGVMILPYLDEYVDIDYVNGTVTLKPGVKEEFIDPYIEILNAEIDKLRAEADKAQQWLDENLPKAQAELDAKLDKLAEQLKALEVQYKDHANEEYLAAKAIVMAEIEKLEAMYDQLKAQAEAVENYLTALQAAIAEVELAMADVIAAAEIVGEDLKALYNALTKLYGELVDMYDAAVKLHGVAVEQFNKILAYCGISTEEFLNMLKSLPKYVDVLKNALKPLASVDSWAELDGMLQSIAKDLADRLMKFLSEEETQALIKELIAKYGPEIAEKLLNVIAYLFEEYGHDVAVAFYYFLYNNPEDVIAFFNEYGDEIADLAAEYGDEALAVISYVLYMYGEDIAEYVIENHEEIFANLAYWVEIHGERMLDLINVYAEALGLCDAVREQIAILENEINALEMQAQAQIAALQAQIAALEEMLKTAHGNMKTEIENMIADLEAQIAAIETAVLAQIAMIKAAIADLNAALQAIYNSGLNQIEELMAAIDAIEAALEDLNIRIGNVIEIAKKVTAGVNAVVEFISARIGNIFEGEIDMADEIYYLAIITEDSEAYAELVAADLKLDGEHFKKVTMDEVTAEDIARATFITVGYNATSAVDFAIEQMLGKAGEYVTDVNGFVQGLADRLDAKVGLNEILEIDSSYEFIMSQLINLPSEYAQLVDEALKLQDKEIVELDWVGMIGAENVPYVEAVKAELRAALIENGVPEVYTIEVDIIEMAVQLFTEDERFAGMMKYFDVDKFRADMGEYAEFKMDIEIVDLIVFAAESALYEFVSYNKEYAGMILSINEINPDATVALLGNYNRYVIDYGFVTEEVNIALADVLAQFGIESFALPAEVEYALEAITGSDINVEELIAEYNYTIESRYVTGTDVLDMMANITSIHPFAYSVVFINMFYVDIADALNGGDAYIAEQILAKLVKVCAHEYDDCNDTICNICGAERAPGAHSFTKYESDNNATCGKNGTKTAYCDYRCGAFDTIEDEGSALTHSYKVVSTTAGTCKNVSTVTYQCVHCGHSYAIAGTYGDHVPGAAATCTTAQICTECYAVLVGALGHKPGAAATCTMSQKCTVCGDVLDGASGHKPGAAATCTTAQTCTVCDAVLAEALGHMAGAAATCTTAQTCTVCGEVLAEALGHKAGAAATCTADQKCTVCGEVLAKATGHKAGAAATCTADQKCTVCGTVLAKATGHKAGAAATCTADQKCTVCGEVLAKATGHKWTDATCKAPKTCSVCKATEGSTAAHKFGDWVVTKEAAAGVAGEKTRTCSVCGATETEVIEALPVEPTTDPVVEPTEPTEPSDPTDPTEPKEGLSTGAIVGISAASVTVAGGAAVAIWFALKKKIF